MSPVIKLKLGILTNDIATLAPWELRLFDEISNDPLYELTAVLTGDTSGSHHRARATSVADRLFALDARIISARSQGHDAAAFEAALQGTKVWLVARSQAGTAGTIGPETIAAFSALDLDVLLVHGLDDLSTTFGRHAKYGAWSLRFGSERLDAGSSAQALYTFNNGPRVSLVASSAGQDGHRLLATACFNIEHSPAMTLMRTAEKSVALILRELRRLARSGKLPASDHTTAMVPDAVAGRSYAAAFSGKAQRMLTSAVAKSSGRLPLRWSLFFGKGAFDEKALSHSREIVPAKGEFWADPFLFMKDGETFVFFENYVYKTGAGKITAGVMRDGRLQIIGDALDLPYHLSFPLVFEHDGQIFMMPETCGAKRIEIWRAVEFPLRWERHASALHGQSVADPVLFRDQNRWWLFANISTTPFEDHCNELHVFEIDGPDLKMVEPHPLNPVVIGSDSARNAGRIIRRDGKILRRSQNNSNGIYGYGLNVMEITKLDSESYEERLLVSIAPDFNPGLIGIHHLDECDGIYVVDACRRFG